MVRLTSDMDNNCAKLKTPQVRTLTRCMGIGEAWSSRNEIWSIQMSYNSKPFKLYYIDALHNGMMNLSHPKL